MHEGPVDEERSARFLLVVLIILVVGSLFILRPFLTGAVFALVVGYLLQRPYAWLAKRLHSRVASASLLVLLTVLVVVAPLVGVAYAIADEGRHDDEHREEHEERRRGDARMQPLREPGVRALQEVA
ncbi:MAG TPA: hypothetical protein VM582_05590, partial [Candidatus Thermoplasmatota archaeon]|nr:hypothetical protein [Candidatus Thermoplasmatota archaeon]